MLKKTLLATATAGLIAAGTMTTASAAPYHSGPGFFFGGPGWGVQVGPVMPPPPMCRPVTKQVKWWDRFGRPHWRTVTVRECPPPHHHHYNYGPGW